MGNEIDSGKQRGEDFNVAVGDKASTAGMVADSLTGTAAMHFPAPASPRHGHAVCRRETTPSCCMEFLDNPDGFTYVSGLGWFFAVS